MIVYTERHGAASNVAIEGVREELGVSSDSWVVGFWRGSDGAFLNNQVLIYSTSEIQERNDTFEVGLNFKGMVAVGDDSGGRVILINKNGSEGFFLVDAGSVSLDEADKFETLEGVLDFIGQEDDDIESRVGNIVALGCKPSLEEIIGVKKSLGLNLSVVELKAVLAEQGKVVLKSVYEQRYKEALVKFSHIIEFRVGGVL
ncbi:SMI1/KNR4 family protein [Pseudomonas sp. H9]|uniref:SMI1/KNR4 family protein n=1 Tax=Pseudomonas sp. H9 TaxID=483968 RepID=UPI0010581D10|nr:SMI1/KNR4 family protein [Pseudomonas sp. H9]TDF83725.1 SMI1/KNR4 family protein [Pseudomonas sp. H9]